MSLPNNKSENLFSAGNTLVNLLPSDDLMVLFSKEIYPIFSDDDFKDCYSIKGRNAISPAFFSLITILQWKESLSDPEAAEAVVRRLDWKIALHLPVDYNDSFNPSSLCYFRKRLKENNKMSLIFDKILGLVQKKGFIKKRSKQRIDSTHIITHVNRISTTDLLFRTVKCLIEEIEKNDKNYYENNIPEDIKERYSQRFSSFGLSKEKRGDKQAEIVEDGLYLKSILEKIKSKNLQELEQLEIMETVFQENVIIKKKEINEKIFIEVDEIECPKQTIFNPRDRSMKLGKKGRLSWVGSKCHIVETAEKGQVNFITNMIQQSAPAKDILKHDEIREGNKQKGLKPKKTYVDSSYMSSNAIKKYQQEGRKLMGYIDDGTNSKKDPRFQKRNFKIKVKQKKIICPMGKKNSTWNESKDKTRYNVYFNKNDCLQCKYKKECVGEKTSQRLFQVSVDYEYLQRRRKEQKTKKFKEEMSVRAQVEGTISALVRFHGLRKAKYKGEMGRELQYLLSACGLNVKRLLKKIKNTTKRRELIPST